MIYRLLFAFMDRMEVFVMQRKKDYKLWACLLLLFAGWVVQSLTVNGARQAIPSADVPAAIKPAAKQPVAALPSIKSEAAILMVGGSKRVLFEKDSTKIMYPASTTKIMTLMTALRHGKLNDAVVVGPETVGIEGSSLELRLLDRLTLRELLYGLILASGNDAAHAVARHVGGGSSGKFIGWMNEEAERIGALRTHFTNPHGLPDPINHFTTAYDLALITDEGFKIKGFEEYVSTPYHTVIFQNRPQGIPLVNTNKLLLTYSGANGVKTGETREAGKCLVSSARRGDVLLIAVILNGGEGRFKESALLLDYGFGLLGK